MRKPLLLDLESTRSGNSKNKTNVHVKTKVLYLACPKDAQKESQTDETKTYFIILSRLYKSPHLGRVPFKESSSWCNFTVVTRMRKKSTTIVLLSLKIHCLFTGTQGISLSFTRHCFTCSFFSCQSLPSLQRKTSHTARCGQPTPGGGRGLDGADTGRLPALHSVLLSS